MERKPPLSPLNMLCDRILRNVASLDAQASAGKRIDHVELHWHEIGLRALRKTTRGGRALRILLPPGVALRHGDVLFEDAASLAVVEVVPTQVLVIRPRTLAEMATLALEIGNLHAPAQATEAGELLALPDGPIEAILWRLDLPHALELRRFTPLTVDGLARVGLGDGFQVAGGAVPRSDVASADAV